MRSLVTWSLMVQVLSFSASSVVGSLIRLIVASDRAIDDLSSVARNSEFADDSSLHFVDDQSVPLVSSNIVPFDKSSGNIGECVSDFDGS